MAENTAIQWCDHTWSPWEGCQKAGPGCDNCYAEAMNKWLRKGENWGPGAPRRIYGEDHWDKPVKWQRNALKFETLHGRRQRVFPSVCDPFDNAAPMLQRERMWGLIRLTPALDWLLVTKRVGNVRSMLPADWGDGYPNVWIIATVVNQEEADRDLDKLLAVPARVRGLSVEPQIGPVNLNPWLLAEHGRRQIGAQPGLDWVIVGGESGRKARDFDIAWPRQIVSQCKAAGVPVFVKQMGAKPVWSQPDDGIAEPPYWGRIRFIDKAGGMPEEWPADLRVREWPIQSTPGTPSSGRASVEGLPGTYSENL